MSFLYIPPYGDNESMRKALLYFSLVAQSNILRRSLSHRTLTPAPPSSSSPPCREVVSLLVRSPRRKKSSKRKKIKARNHFFPYMVSSCRRSLAILVSLQVGQQKKAQPKLRLQLPAYRNDGAICSALIPRRGLCVSYMHTLIIASPTLNVNIMGCG